MSDNEHDPVFELIAALRRELELTRAKLDETQALVRTAETERRAETATIRERVETIHASIAALVGKIDGAEGLMARAGVLEQRVTTLEKEVDVFRAWRHDIGNLQQILRGMEDAAGELEAHIATSVGVHGDVAGLMRWRATEEAAREARIVARELQWSRFRIGLLVLGATSLLSFITWLVVQWLTARGLVGG